MRIEADIPDFMPPERMDDRLASGWWRTGSLMLRTSLLHLGDALHEVVHIRSRLDRAPPSRSGRRLLRRNRLRFDVEVGPATVDDARRALYAKTRSRFIGPIMDELRDLALPEDPAAFHTHEVAVYDGDALVAVSYFDVGGDSVASILGLYDPAYRRDSLGRFTMLEEMRWARARGCRLYYPGYVVPGVPTFDYKLGLGALERLTPRAGWQPLDGPPQISTRVRYLEGRLGRVESLLVERGHAPRKRIYPAFWLGRWANAPRRFVGGQRHLQCVEHASGGQTRVLVVDHLTDRDVFVIGWTRPLEDIDPFEGYTFEQSFVDACEHRVLFHRGKRWVTDDPHEAADRVAEALDQ